MPRWAVSSSPLTSSPPFCLLNWKGWKALREDLVLRFRSNLQQTTVPGLKTPPPAVELALNSSLANHPGAKEQQNKQETFFFSWWRRQECAKATLLLAHPSGEKQRREESGVRRCARVCEKLRTAGNRRFSKTKSGFPWLASALHTQACDESPLCARLRASLNTSVVVHYTAPTEGRADAEDEADLEAKVVDLSAGLRANARSARVSAALRRCAAALSDLHVYGATAHALCGRMERKRGGGWRRTNCMGRGCNFLAVSNSNRTVIPALIGGRTC